MKYLVFILILVCFGVNLGPAIWTAILAAMVIADS